MPSLPSEHSNPHGRTKTVEKTKMGTKTTARKVKLPRNLAKTKKKVKLPKNMQNRQRQAKSRKTRHVKQGKSTQEKQDTSSQEAKP